MPRKKTLDKDLEMLRSAWEAIQDLEREHKKVVTLSVTPTVQRGVFFFRISAIDREPPDGEERGSSAVSMRFPSASDVSLAGFIFSLAFKLEGLVSSEEDARNRLENMGG